MSTLFEVLLNGLTFGCAYALLALSINVIYSSSNVLSFAQGEFMMVGAMLSWSLYASSDLPYGVMLVIALLIVGGLGLVQFYLIAWPLLKKRASIVTIIIATLGLGISIRISAGLIFGKVSRNVHSPVGTSSVTLGPLTVTGQELVVIGATLVVFLALWIVYGATTAGKALRAVAYHEEGALLVGINVRRVMSVAFFASAAMAALAGLLIAPMSLASPFNGLSLAIFGFAAAIVGGLGSAPGALVGGVVVGISTGLFGSYVSSGWADLFTFGLILVMLYARPTGLFSEESGSRA